MKMWKFIRDKNFSSHSQILIQYTTNKTIKVAVYILTLNK
jgi:hypothetical protein